MPSTSQSTWPSSRGFMTAVISVALALLLRAAVLESVGNLPLLILFVTPILLSSYQGGLRAGLLATALAGLGTAYFRSPPDFLSRSEDWMQWTILWITGIIASLLAERLHSARRSESVHTEALTARNRQLSESRSDLNRAQAVAETGSWRMDVRRNRLLWSDETYRIFGLSRDKPLTYEAFLAAVHPDDHDLVDMAWKAALRGETYDIEHRILVDGEIKWVREKAELEFDAQAVLRGGFGTVQDITERKRAEDSLRKSEARKAAILQSALDCIITMDHEGKIIEFNPAAEETFGYASKDVIGKTLAETIIPLELRERHRQGIEHYLSTGEGPVLGKRIEMPAMRADGSKFPAELSILVVPGSGPPIFTGFIRDISVRKRIEKEIRELNSELDQRVQERTRDLERSNRELEAFAYVASHDLQEPLRTVTGFVQLLEQRYKGKLDADADRFIGFIVDGALRMRQQINDLLAYSRAGTKQQALAPTNSGAALEQALANLHSVCLESGAVVTHDALPTVMADAGQLVQIFQNLIGNAVKFRSEAPPRVHVSAVKKESDWIFSVKDNGIGIDPEFHERIFAIFQRLHGRAEHPGTGIGLAICKKLVERLGGRIWVVSEPEKGATFYFTIPAKGD